MRLCFSLFLFRFFFFFFTEAPTITDETDAVISSVYAKFHGEPVTASQGTKQYSVPTTAGVVGSSTRQCAIVSFYVSFSLFLRFVQRSFQRSSNKLIELPPPLGGNPYDVICEPPLSYLLFYLLLYICYTCYLMLSNLLLLAKNCFLSLLLYVS